MKINYSPLNYYKFSLFLYRTHNSIKRYLSHPIKVSQILISIGFVIMTFFISTEIPLYAATTAITIYVILFFLEKLIFFFIKKKVKNTGIDVKELAFAGNYIIRDNTQKACKINLENISTDKFEFFQEDKAEIAGNLNFKAYKRGVWGTSLEDKIARNRSHIKRNSHCFMAIKDVNEPNRYVGYTHILPVDKSTWDEYMAGKIGDNDFSYLNIIPDISDKDDQKPYGLIIFSIANIYPLRSFKTNKSYREEVGELLEQAVTFHLHTMIKKHFPNHERVSALLQTKDKGYISFFKKIANMDKVTLDGGKIVSFKILN